ncbi:MAG: MOSC domain-containing protein [Nitriliruptoraceae bacterium]
MGQTAIDKQPVVGVVRVTRDGVAGDAQANHRHHGGPDQAVYAYGSADAVWWQDRIGAPRPPGSFGENLRVAGIDVSATRIGDHWRVGGVVVEVTGPRIPCRVLAGFWDRPGLIDEFIDAGRPGAYLRVIEPGSVVAGDPVTVEPAATTVTVADTLRIVTRAPHRAAELAEIAARTTPAVRRWLAAQGVGDETAAD